MPKRDEADQDVLAVDRKRLTERGNYTYELSLNKKALREAWVRDCETSGFIRFRDWLKQEWVVSLAWIGDGFEINVTKTSAEGE